MRAGLSRLAVGVIAFGCAGLAEAQLPTGSLQADYLAPLREASCPKDVKRETPVAIDLTVRHVPLQAMNAKRKVIGDLTFVAGFHLTSSNTRFGGLSGIDVLEDGNLLAVSDDGAFVWIDLAEDGVTPTAARIAGMQDATGKVMDSKAGRDAEGLAYADGLALVSYEGDHRVLAFDVGACGAAARGAPLRQSKDLSFAFARDGLLVGGNEGLEALAVTPDWFLFAGLESGAAKASALSARAVEMFPKFNLEIGRGAPPVVGLDLLPGGNEGQDVRAFSLHRSTNAFATNVITLVETVFARELDQAGLPARVVSEIEERGHVRFREASTRVLAEMNLFVTIDNYEGIAARALPDGRVRLYVIADDNFSAKQRTLLMIYDVAKRG